jgi:quercetin dioxygenase-like cupin family protein
MLRRPTEKDDNMRKKWMWVILLSAATVITALSSRKAQATPASGFVGITLGGIPGRFGEIDVFTHFIPPNSEWEKHRRNIWLSWQKTKGSSDLYVQSNVWQPGGSSGWHLHPGHSLIFVTEGTVTYYESDSPDCKPTVYTKGMGFVEPGDHVHIVRNEGAVLASTIAVQLIPASADRRVDAPQPANCLSF